MSDDTKAKPEIVDCDFMRDNASESIYEPAVDLTHIDNKIFIESCFVVLNDKEKDVLAGLTEDATLQQLAFFWAAKEAMYKQHEQLGIDFSRDFYIPTLTTNKQGSMPAYILHKELNKEVTLDYHFGEDYVSVTSYAK